MSLKISDFAFFQLYTDYSNFIYFVKCKRPLFQQNSYQPYSSSERERKFRRRLFRSSIKREIRNFHVVVVQWRKRNVQKSVTHIQSCCFAYSTYCFFWRSRCRRRSGILKSLRPRTSKRRHVFNLFLNKMILTNIFEKTLRKTLKSNVAN